MASALDSLRRGRTDRNVRKIMQFLGMLAMAFGFFAIVLGWYGASHSGYQYEEIPFVISGGLLGLGLIIGGGVLVRCAWSLRQVEEARRNAVEARRDALAIVRSVERLEQALSTWGEQVRTSDDHQKETTP
jgi:hypothetical protein